jgi:Mannosyl-glycoprotein endo-beta-N-acetylglucosaminidase
VVLAILPAVAGEPREPQAAKEAAPSRAAGEAEFRQALEGAKKAPAAGNLVPVVRTHLSAGQAQDALRAAWENVTGEAPSAKTLALITAQWAHETGHGASMYNYNFAGIKGTGPSGLSVAQHTKEGWGDTERRIVDNFRAYRTAEEGATDYVQLLARRFPDAVQGAKDGDPAAFVRGLKSRGYFTGNEGAYLSSVANIAGRYLGQELEVSGAPPTLDYRPSQRAEGPLDLQGLYAQMAPSPDTYVDALTITDQINRAALRAFAAPREDS